MVGPFLARPRQEGSADTGTEEHRHPAQAGEFRPRIGAAKTHLAVFAKCEVELHAKTEQREPDVQRAELVRAEFEDVIDDRAGSVPGQEQE